MDIQDKKVGDLMAKRRIASLLCSMVFSIPLLDVKVIQAPPKPTQIINCVEKADFKNYKVKLIEEQAEIEIQKRKEIKKEIEERFVEETVVYPNFNPYDVSEPSNINKEQILQMLDGTALTTLVDAFYWYEQEYRVNAIFVASIVALESSWGRSSLAISHNNLTGYIGRSGEYYYFQDWGENLEETFRLISEEYIMEDGLFYNGKSTWNINQRYCELDSWADKINNIGYELLAKIN